MITRCDRTEEPKQLTVVVGAGAPTTCFRHRGILPDRVGGVGPSLAYRFAGSDRA